jgi:hypothetical protein
MSSFPTHQKYYRLFKKINIYKKNVNTIYQKNVNTIYQKNVNTIKI